MSPFQPVFHDYNKNLIERARANRKEMTPAERRMWFDILKNLPYRFLKQRVIGNYIADFYCAAHQLVIEVDGDSHFNEEAIAYDLERTLTFFHWAFGLFVLQIMKYYRIQMGCFKK
jgi:very-short-patch-repair endonuclease